MLTNVAGIEAFVIDACARDKMKQQRIEVACWGSLLPPPNRT
jgi:hypothetical protein